MSGGLQMQLLQSLENQGSKSSDPDENLCLVLLAHPLLLLRPGAVCVQPLPLFSVQVVLAPQLELLHLPALWPAGPVLLACPVLALFWELL